jgi:hypothetical protein
MKRIRIRRIKSITSSAANMAGERIVTTLPMLVSDATYGRGAMSVRSMHKAARS